MVKTRSIIVIMVLTVLLSACRQERMLFYPESLPADFKFTFNNNFEELFFEVDEKTKLHGLLFRAQNSKGLIFYLHGNAGSVDSWGNISDIYLRNSYDFLILDYRGYGKSQGRISSENQLYNDINIVYNSIKKNYKEENIVVIGYSIGTGIAAQLASVNNPRILILKAPYFNMTNLVHQYIKIIPSFLIRYKFKINEYITMIRCPVVLFHGDRDEIIYYGSSLMLQKLFKKEDSLIPLTGQYHNGINYNKIYLEELERILNK